MKKEKGIRGHAPTHAKHLLYVYYTHIDAIGLRKSRSPFTDTPSRWDFDCFLDFASGPGLSIGFAGAVNLGA